MLLLFCEPVQACDRKSGRKSAKCELSHAADAADMASPADCRRVLIDTSIEYRAADPKGHRVVCCSCVYLLFTMRVI